MSVARADRTGATGLELSEWNRAAKRVIPPSTPSSKTTSAWLSPICGRAFGALSIFPTRTGRFDRTMSIGSPVSGEADIVGGAGTAGGGPCGPRPGVGPGTGGGGAPLGFGFAVAGGDVAPRGGGGFGFGGGVGGGLGEGRGGEE